MRTSSGTSILSIFLMLILTSLACTIGSGQSSSKPAVAIIAPKNESNLTVGQEVIVEAVVADAKGINKVELWVDGQLVDTLTLAAAASSQTIQQTWIPRAVGQYIVEVRAYNVDNVVNDPAQLFINVGQLTTSDPVASPTLSKGSGSLGTPDPEPAQEPGLTTLTGLNVRAGPGTDYPVIGKLTQGQSARVTGQNPAGTWWQIIYPPDSQERGWVSAAAQYSAAHNTGGVPVVQDPSLTPDSATPDSTAQPTPTDVNTPQPTRVPTTPPAAAGGTPTVYYFDTDKYTIKAGEYVTLSWDLVNANTVHLHYDGIHEGVVAPGSKRVSPTATTVYTLVAQNDTGRIEKKITITVKAETAVPPLQVEFWADAYLMTCDQPSTTLNWRVTGGDVRNVYLESEYQRELSRQTVSPQGSKVITPRDIVYILTVEHVTGSQTESEKTALQFKVERPTSPPAPDWMPEPGHLQVGQTEACGRAQRELGLPVCSGSLVFSPDGNQVAVLAPGGVYTMQPDGSQLQEQITPPGYSPGGDIAWSPLGMYIAYSYNDHGTTKVAVVRYNGTNPNQDLWVINPDGVTDWPRWTTDQRLLVKSSTIQPVDQVYVAWMGGPPATIEAAKRCEVYEMAASAARQEYYPWGPGRTWVGGSLQGYETDN